MRPPTHKLWNLYAFETIVYKQKRSIIVQISQQVALLA